MAILMLHNDVIISKLSGEVLVSNFRTWFNIVGLCKGNCIKENILNDHHSHQCELTLFLINYSTNEYESRCLWPCLLLLSLCYKAISH